MGVHTDTFGKRVFVGAVWGEQHQCTLPSPLDATLRLAVRCSQKEFMPLAQALQSLPQPLQHHDTERALVWLLLDPATAGMDPLWTCVMSKPTPKLGLRTPMASLAK